MTNCKYKLRKLSVGLVSVGTMLIAPTVLGQEVSVSTETSASTSTSTASAGTSTSETAASGTASGTNGASSVTSSEGSQSSESAPASPQPQAQTAVASSSSSSNANASSSSDGKAPQAASTTSSSTPAAASSNGISQGTSAEAETPMMEVEQYTVGNKTTELNIKDGAQLKNGSKVDKDTKLIRNRDGEQRDIVDIKREVKTNADGTVDVTVTVTPKEIDKGADVMALLDVSKKMTEDDFNNAKDKIKKLVTTLTSKSPDSQPNHNARNSVRLMTFYRKVNDPIELNADNVDAKLDEVWKKAKEDWDWGVDLQGAIHKAREIFNKGKRKKSGKRQHIVLFSQGESTFSYDINDKDENDTVQKNRIAGKVTTSNPLFPWLPIFNHTNQKAEVIDDVDKLLGLAEKMGISLPDGLRAGVKAIGAGSSFLSTFTGSGLTEYLTLNEYRSDILKEKQFDYTKRVGEGYYYHSYSKRTHGDKMPFEKQIREVLERFLPKIEDKEWPKKFIEIFGLQEKEVNQIGVDVIMKVINSIFYKREYHYYNHNLSAIAEAKMAQKEGITFYSVDVTDSDKASKRVKRQVGNEQSKKKKEDAEKDRNNKFDDYLKKMSEGGNFLSKVEERGKFKDTLTELTIKDEFTNKVKVQEDSEGKKYKTGLISGTSNVTHTPAKTGFFSSNESLTWTISKEQLKKAFEDGTSLTLTYKLKVENDKFKKSLEEDNKKKRAKRSAPTENENSVTEKIISNTTTYKINEQKVEGNKFDDVNLTYSKFKVPVPQIDGQVIEPQAPKLPDLPPVIEHGPVLDYTEESIYRLPLEHGSNAPDTQVTIEEDTVPQRPDILVGGQSGPVDITEDTQPGMSGSNDATVVEEDTTPQRPDVLVGGQSDPIDITEDTQPGMSGSNEATVVEEDTAPQRPDILVGGQSDPIDITEDTQPGMSGSNDATVIEEDTKPKRFFHFDNEPQAPEKPKEQPSLSLPQAPVYKAAHHLPASGDKREASFTIVALTIIGAAGLLSKKRRDTEEN
ncbi:TPA: serum opacification factor [Streptococcus pyogenes]|uniref:serum opacification factor n=1 Tax=Streptococcus pyogenes TaxID=1314 RepID=UPI000640B735|nr:serum opacification factor [Streptococcus pyogenes]HER4536241.1 fibronectin binding protein [Streptococcus pyogenes NGAS757]HER4587565.1 fibronectin binding protein [Streptococcus pyogenes NGAS615]HER4596116.1 fibronectin binding protein [Streptococcus pyogenes NGAS613]HER4602973.1 fibronectin binding protein [Streptococcus pyogenes NGAS608]HER4606125.1 fibronectin binding protein [Streptococcus pyogenes NGAS609]HER4609543.1 fibronectin binding protein [Streptococcus pyogenes NGAS601]HER4